MINGIIYKITSIVNKKCYIGQTYQPIKTRWYDHIKGRGSKALYNAIQKHGLEMFKFEVIHEGINCREVLNRLEIALIEAHNAYTDGYNQDRGGQDEFRYSEAWEHSDEICRLYRDEFHSTRQLAKTFRTNYKTITVILESKGVQRRNKSHAWEYAKEICNLYTDGKSVKKIAEKYGVSSRAIRKILEEGKIKIRPPNRPKKKGIRKYAKEICRLYTIEKKGYVEIAECLGTNKNMIRRILIENNIELRSHSPRRKRSLKQQITLDF